MKTPKSILVLIITGLLLAKTSAMAQTVMIRNSPATEDRSAEAAVRIERPAGGSVTHLAHGKPEVFALAQATQEISDPISADVATGFHFGVNPWSGPANSRALIVTDQESPGETLSALQEDMSVMARILDKSVRKNLKGEDSAWAMGIKILSIGGSGGGRNFYLDGYGAVFVLNVPYPLIAPPKVDETERTKKDTNAVWEETKRELYGPREDGFLKKFWAENKPAYEYSAETVKEIQQSVIGALKNARNIRNLKPEESVVVVVIGPENARSGEFVVETLEQDELIDDGKPKSRRPVARTEKRGRISVGGRTMEPGSRGETQMTIRVKKSDIDAFADDKMDFAEFQQKVKVTTY